MNDTRYTQAHHQHTYLLLLLFIVTISLLGRGAIVCFQSWCAVHFGVVTAFVIGLPKKEGLAMEEKTTS